MGFSPPAGARLVHARQPVLRQEIDDPADVELVQKVAGLRAAGRPRSRPGRWSPGPSRWSRARKRRQFARDEPKGRHDRLQQKYPEICTPEDVERLFEPPRAVDLYGDVVRKATEWPTLDHSIKTLAKYLGFTWRDTHPSGAVRPDGTEYGGQKLALAHLPSEYSISVWPSL